MISIEELHQAFGRDDSATVRKALANAQYRKLVNEPIGPFDSPAVCNVRSREMLDVLLEAGADINGRSKWWAGGFGLLDSAKEDLAEYAIERGATLTAHAAARLGMIEKLRELVAIDPGLVHARGGDGKMPLHFARTVEVARFLLEKGADINARDIDHESTAAQHLIGERPEVVRFLVERGCETDVFMAAALGDVALIEKHVAANPDCVRMRVDAQHFPMKNPRAGGTIYQWTLGFNVSPHQVARKFGHEKALERLLAASPPEVQLVNWCWLEEAARAKEVLQKDSRAIEAIKGSDRRALADAARENKTGVVEAMLEAGLPLDAKGQHGGTALHWASWHGNLAMVEFLLQNGGKRLLEEKDRDFQAPPLGWARHGSENGWHAKTGDYAGVIKALEAAAKA